MGNYFFTYEIQNKVYTLEDYELEKDSNCKNLFFYNINELQDKGWSTVPSDQTQGLFESFDCEE